MSKVFLSEEVANQLQGLSQPVDLCDSSGKRLGCFVPAFNPSEYEIVGPDLSEEELREIEQSNEWYSTDQVLRRLEKLR
jgi:hypothetical protein